MIIPDYEASKKQYHSVEEEYLVHGNHPLFYFPPELSCWKAHTLWMSLSIRNTTENPFVSAVCHPLNTCVMIANSQ